ncbi:mandelate racemase/muconate lactonizing enzyme family protein [Coraliomargarita akajimensis]|uniref:Mandelate racemase/muconate lactonizing protein n=1 Tax=Coraliomargarita akajimensis (strain DSM 45221 / IAM 15411 / JCM 23193 / KCTC 12865 / 04OKA010-24) TaxID=583355 RepID=D5EQU6_CORAD|nr:mandelate racemase/muconate lactonizing enzyme family protein [Coraliomargarita akajimensis]ADE53939.1 Mandelate racemase/muconate lactonizing protein [Coraliomargarita akajimensis DSM 45221]
MKITKLEPIILHAPVTRGGIADSTHSITHWGAPGVAIHTDSGHIGYGFSGTHAHLPTDRLIVECIVDSYGPLLIGEDPMEVRALWEKLHKQSEIYWVGRSGITHLALGAIDIALWDLKAKALDMPLWKLLGGSAQTKVEAYNTDGGWLNWSKEDLISDCKRMVEEQGYRAVKLKVGGESGNEDLRRVEAVRTALGSEIRIMTDANGRWSLPQAIQIGSRLADFDITWIEEPTTFDDVIGHQRLAESISTPIAMGEQLYLAHQFRDFIHAGAVHYVQPDIVRLAGVTEWWQVADLAHSYSLPVVPHVGDMCQVHQHLCNAHPACNLLEYIPWLRDWMKHPAEVKDGYFVTPESAGAGMEPSLKALETINVY